MASALGSPLLNRCAAIAQKIQGFQLGFQVTGCWAIQRFLNLIEQQLSKPGVCALE
jgi:hypothetical protein